MRHFTPSPRPGGIGNGRWPVLSSGQFATNTGSDEKTLLRCTS
jgi:hypothetical protein